MKVQLLLRLFCISKIAVHNEIFIAQVGADKAEYDPKIKIASPKKKPNVLANLLSKMTIRMFICLYTDKRKT